MFPIPIPEKVSYWYLFGSIDKPYNWSHRVVVILPLCHSGDTSSILVGTAKLLEIEILGRINSPGYNVPVLHGPCNKTL